MIFKEADEAFLSHYGILRKSGRYPWGSGNTPQERGKTFLGMVEDLRDKGLKDAEIAIGLGLESTTDLRKTKSLANNALKIAKIGEAQRLKDKGYSNIEIGKTMGLNESSVRSLLLPGQKEKALILANTADLLRREVADKGLIQIGKGVEHFVDVGISKERLATAIAILEDEGYVVHTVQTPQLGSGGLNKTGIKVLGPPGTTYRSIVSDMSKIKSITQMSDNGGRTNYGILPPISIDSKRIAVKYKEDGGGDVDGVIYVRRGKEDLSLGNARYAQVRILVDGTHFLKGMALYSDDMPRGVDLVFNTNKSKKDPKIKSKLDSMKPAVLDPDTKEIDKDNPFGAVIDQIGKNEDGVIIRQRGKKDENDKIVEVTSAMNLINAEGDWNTWKNTISSQVLSKQSPKLAQQQLDETFNRSKAELDEIMALTNPTVKRKLLETYADGADASAVHLKAASLPRQRSQVIIPINSLKESEVYAPNFRNGERVALVRYPHGGTFEIPELIVNNRNAEARKALGTQPEDVIAIHSNVAKRLSGADFDGDSVLVIPNPIDNPLIKTTPALEGLKNFDPQSAYPGYDGMPKMTPQTKGTQMGIVSNLITDMTIQGATTQEKAAALRHSMVVIDAEKHDLNYKQSALDNGIRNLQKKYQPRNDGRYGGASTLISRAKSRKDIPRQKARTMAKGGPVDKATGKKVFIPTDEKYVDKKTGKVVTKMQTTKKLIDTDDARTLMSKDGVGTPIERVYANHSNRMKALANQARKEAVNTPGIVKNPSAVKTYDEQVKSLTAKLKIAEKNAPLERQAQVIANTIATQKKAAAVDMDNVQRKRIEAQALDEARRRMGAGKKKVEIEPDEWKAIQAGAISNTRLSRILTNADMKKVKELATPRANAPVMTAAKMAKVRSMMNGNYTQAEIADAIGVSLTTLKNELSKGGG